MYESIIMPISAYKVITKFAYHIKENNEMQYRFQDLKMIRIPSKKLFKVFFA